MKPPLPTTRRTVLTGTGAGFIVAVTSACGSGDEYVAPADGFSVPATTAVIPAGEAEPDPDDPPNLGADEEEAPAADADAGAGEAAGPAPLASLDDIPIGTAKALKGADGKKIIISHPAKGKVAAFSAICTHAGCAVKPVGTSLDCPCHGSKFDYATGEVTAGPANKPLPAVQIHMKQRNIMPGPKA
jgi:Rieske Fe-S protein